jgi:RNA polymerase sigma-70 factor (ECF subfamily)
MGENDLTRNVSPRTINDDHLLVKRVQKGDQDAFNDLLKRYYSAVYNLVAHSVRSHEEREDLIQEVFIKVYRNLGKFRFEASFSTWLYRITRNMLIDRSRKKAIHPVSMESEEGGITIGDRVQDHRMNPEGFILESDSDITLRDALMKLDENHRHILILREMEGLSYRELAKVLEINTGTVKSRLARAREELKNHLMKI